MAFSKQYWKSNVECRSFKLKFSALKYFNPNIVANKNSYYDFISQFTEIEHIRNSKYIRQVIFEMLT